MPVVILGGSRFVALAVARAMSAVSPEVRAVTGEPADAPALRDAGAKVAVGSIVDPDLLDSVLPGAHTMCLLGPAREWWAGGNLHQEIVENAEPVLDRARAADIRRVLVTVGASSSPEVARALEEQRLLVERTGIPSAIVRTSFVYGPGSALLRMLVDMARSRPAARLPGTGTQRWAPVLVEDLAAVLAAADDRARLGEGSWGLDGPDVVAVNDLVDLLAGRHRRWRRSVTAADGSGAIGGLDDAGLEHLSGDLIAGPPSAANEFGVALTPLRAGLERSLP
jgi:nucleoside-diphosphate-sugar epimerase